ncbi:MAG: PPC domain-containing DNA-binding protein [bacterium]
MKQIKIRIPEGEELVTGIERELHGKGISSATIISCVGAFRQFQLVTIYQNSEEIPPEHFARKFDKKAELMGNGTVSDGKVHLHVVCGTEGGAALSGHLVSGIVTYFADVTILVG